MMSEHAHDSHGHNHDHGGHAHDHSHGGHDEHGHDSHGHDSHGHDDHGHGHESWGDYNSQPPGPSNLPHVSAPWLAAFGIALAALMAAIVSFSLRVAEMPEHPEHGEEGAAHGHAEKSEHGKEH